MGKESAAKTGREAEGIGEMESSAAKGNGLLGAEGVGRAALRCALRCGALRDALRCAAAMRDATRCVAAASAFYR